LRALRDSLEAIKASRSWRVTAPIRRMHGMIGRLFQKRMGPPPD